MTMTLLLHLAALGRVVDELDTKDDYDRAERG
jgi:hypothetical protein